MTAPQLDPNAMPAYAGPPLRIAYVGNFRHPWCTEVHVAASLEQLGHHVVRCQEDATDWGDVANVCDEEGVQLLLWTRTWPADMDSVLVALDRLRDRGIPSVSYHLDRWFGLNREHQVHDQPFFRTDLVVSPDDHPGWAEAGVNHLWLPPGVYGPECEPVPPNPKRWPWQVVFVGSHPYPHPEWAQYRSDLLATFQKAFRGRFGILPRRGQPVRGRDLQELYATVPVVLGDSCLAGSPVRYWSDRVPETLGRGGLLVHPHVEGMDVWYPGDTFLHYDLGDFDHAVGLARGALDARQWSAGVAARGRATVLGRDTYAHRMATVLAVAEGIHGGYRDVRTERDISGLSQAELHRVVAHAGPNNLAAAERAVEARTAATVPIPAPAPLRPTRGLPVAPQPSLQRRVQLGRYSGRFDLRPDVPTDDQVLDEVWVRNDYRVAQRFTGTVVDVGANIGAFAVLAAKAGAKRVVAFEPEPGNLARLQYHLELNNVADVVEAKAMAVNGRGGSLAVEGTGGGARTVPPDEFGYVVPAVSLAEALRDVGDVEFLKMDIEGGEYAAFTQLAVDALAFVDRMALEFHGPAMPHLAHLDADEGHLVRWGELVAHLADAGRVEIFGHPSRGGLIHWQRYGA